MGKSFIWILVTVFFISCHNDQKNPEQQILTIPEIPEIPTIDYSVVNTFPHDTTSYTQGLLIHDKKIIESTGSPSDLKQTKSVLGVLDLITGKINVKAELDKNKYFGEGISILKNKLYQLTWLNQTGFIYDPKTFQPLGNFKFKNKEGWGLTTDGTSLIMSDGTDTLNYMDPATLKIIRSIPVAYSRLNELEYIHGFIYANVYQKNFIAKIDPANGNVVGILDLSALVYKAQQKSPTAEVLNGIAYDSISDKILVTGKLWPFVYQINFKH